MRLKIFLSLVIVALMTTSAWAYVELPDGISDNMVLQQKRANTLWGEARPGAIITVTTSWDKKQYTAPVTAEGSWKLQITAPITGGPYTIKFDDGEALTIRNVMIGEVWLCAGQSNMEMPIGGWGKLNNYQQEIDAADQPLIRILKIKKSISAHPRVDFVTNTMGWQECSPSTVVDDFSATAYFFARNLRQEFPDVAIGLVDASWGGTVVESWTSAGTISQVDVFADTIKRYQALPEGTALKEPVAVRYAWANNPICNLVNGVGLPASPFRTADWPGLTFNKK